MPKKSKTSSKPRAAKAGSQTLAGDLVRHVAGLIEAARQEGRAQALAEVRALVGGTALAGAAAPVVKRGPGRPRKDGSTPAAPKAARKSSGKPRKNPWEGLSPAERLKRVNAIRKGRGLPVKTTA